MKLFEPGKIGKLSLKNRIIMAPMGVSGSVEPDGRLSQQAIDYLVTRAKGGVGLIDVGHVRVNREIELLPNIPFVQFLMADNIMCVARFSQLADGVHDYGAKVCIELTAGLGRCLSAYLIKAGAKVVAPSDQPCLAAPDIMAKQLTIKEIERFIKMFGTAAELLRTAGIDAIELHGHEGYLFDQFMTTLWNRRTDKYGGDLDGRLSFSREVIKAIKNAAGADFPVIYRFGLTHYLAGGREISEGLEIARRLEAAGADAFHVDAGCHETMYVTHPTVYGPPGPLVDLARMVKEVVKVPVITVGRLGYPELAEKVLQEGKADFIALGRALLADPEWPNKVREGRAKDIRPCIGDHYCLARLFQHKYVSCTTNPEAGNEKELAIRPAERKKSVLVIGGGPGGMEAAMVSALRGHNVVLWEKEKRLGGRLIAASVPDFKQDYRNLIEYLLNQIGNLGVKIELGKEATVELVKKASPEAVFVANGGAPVVPPFPIAKSQKVKVIDAVDMLVNKRETGKSVIVVGGGLVGAETALYLLRQSKKVTIVEILDTLARDLQEVNRTHLLKLFSEGGVNIMCQTEVVEISNEGVVTRDKAGKKNVLKADSVVLALGFKPDAGLSEALRKVIPEVYAVGDCVQPRKVTEAIWEAYRAARLV